MSQQPHSASEQNFDRRQFLQKSSTVAAATTVAVSGLLSDVATAAEETKSPKSETLVTQLYQGMTDKQKKVCAFPFDHPLRKRIDNNWNITRTEVGTDFDKDQQQLIREIFQNLHSPEYAKAVMKQVEHDSRHDGGFNSCSVALFGKPGGGKFEFVLTGRHVTRRCDGDSVAGAAFGGPIFYGHAAESFNEKADHPGNVYWYQAKRANELFQALDGKQRKLALRNDPRREAGNETIKLHAKKSERHGLPVSEFSADQKELAEKVLADVLAPFREEDREESMKLIKQAGFENLQFSYYKNSDIGHDGVWDVWQIEGPTTVWYFRGAPHVHVWVNIVAG